MAASQILAPAAGALDSADQAITTTTTIGLRDAKNEARVQVSPKDDAGGYQVIGELNAAKPAIVIMGPGTYRFSRLAATTPASGYCGVFSA